MNEPRELISIRWLPSTDDREFEAALETPDNRPGQLWILLPETAGADIPRLQAICRKRSIPLAGALFPQLIADSTVGAPGAILLRIYDAPPPLALRNMPAPELVNVGAAAIAEYVDRNLPGNREGSLFCVFDALVPNIATHLDAWYLRLANRLRYFGVNAGSEAFTPLLCLFDSDSIFDQGALVQILPDHPGAWLEHGYAVPETFITATSAEGNRIIQIDWRPALDVYSDIMKEHYSVVITRENFYTHAVHFPFGILRADGEVLVHIPVALAEDGSIFCIGEIPPNSVLTLLDARAGSHLAPVGLATGLREMGATTKDEDLLLFYCAGRRLHRGPEVKTDLEAALRETRGRHLYGALSLGEIGGARSGGYPLFHNATLVGIPCM